MRPRATIAIALLMSIGPLAAHAQAMPGHDMSSMPGMDTTPKKAVKPAAKKPPTKNAKATEAAAQPEAAPMPHDMHDMPDRPEMPEGKPATHDGMTDMDHAHMTHAPAQPATDMPSMPAAPGPTMDMGAMTKSMQGGSAPADARDPDAYADGLELGHMHGMDMADDARHVYVLVDRIEAVHSHDRHGQALDAQAWYGGDLDRLWLKIDGERSDGRLGATRTEALWHHAIATYWGLQTGVRQDFGDGPGRTWASIGLQGLSPYWFDLQATAYVGEGGRTALRFESEYALLITQRLVLQPDVKMNVFGRNDGRRQVGAGLSDLEAGLRLRYEITRKFGPYVGVVWNRKFGNTARHARQAGEPVQRIEAVAGVRLWF